MQPNDTLDRARHLVVGKRRLATHCIPTEQQFQGDECELQIIGPD